MTSMALLVMIYIFMLILGYWQVEGRRAKKPTYFDYDDESDLFEKMADQEYHIQSSSYGGDEDDPMDEVLDTSDLDLNLDYHMGKNKERLQRKSHSHFPDSWAKLVQEGEEELRLEKMEQGGHFDDDYQMIDEEDEQQH
ncbi:uncharacterized protein LOC26535902 [Drosophila yakuba]|uniref:Uncharacterized protein n=1 Tax=Drosophila yakuba TaxID=7245 RepID=A0A0R1EBF5_DROYA|nr:uncharacterized protein LOC26535902 [Drosophila yakuba]KRK06828.1 uncharacterized protein Dyak_GE28721 [Drosophila yakuba]